MRIRGKSGETDGASLYTDRSDRASTPDLAAVEFDFIAVVVYDRLDTAGLTVPEMMCIVGDRDCA